MGPMTETKRGNRYLIVVSDYFTRWAEAYPVPNHTAAVIADKIVEEFLFRMGIPHQIHTDQGSEFDSELIKEVCRLLRVNKTRTTPYHPQSDGLVERANRTIGKMMAMACNQAHDNWDELVPYIMFAYRASIHATTKCTPNMLMLNREVNLPIDLIHPVPQGVGTMSHQICSMDERGHEVRGGLRPYSCKQ